MFQSFTRFKLPIGSLAALIICLAAVPVSQAAVSGGLTYTDSGTDITIDGTSKPPKGKLVIPSIINGKPVVAIGPNAFAECYGITSVVIPGSVLSVANAAFVNCTGIQTVSIPQFAQLGNSVFDGCGGLKSFLVAAGSPYYKSIDGVLYDSDSTTLLKYPSSRPDFNFTVPADVTEIASSAFFNAYQLRKVQLPAGLQTIGTSAFLYCYELSDIGTIADGVTSIGEGAFQECPKIKSFDVSAGNPNYSSSGGVLFDKGQTEVIKYPPGSTATSYAVPDGVLKIWDYAFEGAALLATVSVPASVDEIGNTAFYGCSGLTSISVNSSNADYSSSLDGVLFNKLQTTLIQYPAGKVGAYVVPPGVVKLNDSAFSSAGQLTSLTLASSTTDAAANFVDCLELAAINAPSDNIAYTSADGILYYKMAGGIAAVPPGITGHVTIPSGETSIDPFAFNGSGVTSVRIPASVTSLGDFVFYLAKDLRTVEFEGDAPAMGQGVFDATAKGFTVRYLAGSVGFTSPKWQGYPAVKMAAFPATTQISVRATNYTGVTQTAKPTVSDPAAMLSFFQQSAQISLTTKSDRSFTGSLLLEGKKFPLKGSFDGVSGIATVTVSRGTKGTATLALQYSGAGRSKVSGSLTIPQGTTSFELNPWSAEPDYVHLLSGKQYTVLLEKYAPAGGPNPGKGYATVAISDDGTATVTGRLSDGGKAFVLSAPVLKDGSNSWLIPVYISLYTSTGLVSGNILIPKQETPDGRNLLGDLTWMRPANSKSSFLPAGFLRGLDAYGESYLPIAGTSVFTGMETASSFQISIDPAVEVLTSSVTQSGDWPASNVPALSGVVPKGFTFKLDPKTGVLTGTFSRPAGTKAVSTSFYGVILDNSAQAYKGGGFFTTESTSGLFELN